MTSTQYRAAIDRLGLTIVGAGTVLGVTGRQSQRYAAGETIPEPVVRLLYLLLRHGVPDEWQTKPKEKTLAERGGMRLPQRSHRP